MSPAKLAGMLLLILGAAAVFHFASSREANTVFEPPVKVIEPASPCPWRDAEQDMTNWFPGATQYRAHDTVLSGKRTELRAQLGREMHPEEMALHTYIITSNDTPLGTVLTRRIKAKHGAIELAIALDTERKLKTFKIQRIREPQAIVDDLATYELERHFAGLCATNDLHSQLSASSSASTEAHEIAQAIASEIKAALVLFEAAERERGDGRLPRHH